MGDIELVAVPHHGPVQEGTSTLFRGPLVNLLDLQLARMVELGLLQILKNGPKYKQFSVHAGPVPVGVEVHLDLFIVEADNFGLHYALRTGPAAYSKALVTRRGHGGLLNDACKVRDGFLWTLASGGEPRDNAPVVSFEDEPDLRFVRINTPYEEDFYSQAGIPYLSPQNRGL